MIFIKNYTDLPKENIVVEAVTQGVDTFLTLTINGEETVELLTTSVKGIKESLERAITKIGTINNCVFENDNGVAATILDNTTTEIAFHTRETKTVIDTGCKFPAIIAKQEEVDGETHYPRDMIVMIVPKRIDGDDIRMSLVVDKRNLGGKIETKQLTDYSVIVMYTKYPVWSKLKYPAYAYLTAENSEGKTPFRAFKLGSKVVTPASKKNQAITRNKIIDVDCQEAVDYLNDTFKALKEKNNNGGKRNGNNNASRGGNTRKPFNNGNRK